MTTGGRRKTCDACKAKKAAPRPKPGFSNFRYVTVDLPPGMSDLPPAPKVTYDILMKAKQAERH